MIHTAENVGRLAKMAAAGVAAQINANIGQPVIGQNQLNVSREFQIFTTKQLSFNGLSLRAQEVVKKRRFLGVRKNRTDKAETFQ